MSRVIFTKNIHHLGDNILCCIFFSKIKNYIEEHNIIINHYCVIEHIEQIKEFNYSPNNIKILNIIEAPDNENIIDLWIGGNYEYNYFNMKDMYDIFLFKFYNQVLKIIDIPIELTDFIFDNEEDLLVRYNEINKKTNDKYKNIELLIINGTPLSGQLDYNLDEWNEIIKKFSEKYNVVTTQKTENIKCTRDDNLTAKDIAAISTRAKKIIAIDSGVAIGLFNKSTIYNVDVVYYMGNSIKSKCSFKNFKYETNIDKLLFLLEDQNKPNIESFIGYSLYYSLWIRVLLSIIIFAILFYLSKKYKIVKNISQSFTKLINKNIFKRNIIYFCWPFYKV